MKLTKHWTILFILLFAAHEINCIEPITLVASVVAGGIISSGGYFIKCLVNECCTKQWINHNITNLQKAIDSKLFGQHLVKRIVGKAVTKHVQNINPQKALVMSFHGWTGSGKNFVSDIILKHVFKEGTASKYYFKKIGPMDYPHKSDVNLYKKELKKVIQEHGAQCSRSVFIFDEVDKMPAGLIDVLKPFVDHHSNVEGVDYRKNIFIFLSNTCGDRINNETFHHFKAGKLRESITSKQMEHILSTCSFNKEGGFQNSDLTLSALIDFFIPFLPMERKHIKQCIEAEMLQLGESDHKNKEEIIESVANELQYFPKGQNIFSRTGCKHVSKKILPFL